MCVGFSNSYDDFYASDVESAIKALVPGSCVSFDRVSLFHFAIFIGFGWPEGATETQPLPLVCHFSGNFNSGSDAASVRLDDFRDVVQDSKIRVYRCSCSARTRARVVADCLRQVGESGYNPLTNNCEHFVRRVINGENASYQSLMTLALPVVQLPRLLLGGLLNGSAISSASSQCGSGCLENVRSIGLVDPLNDFLEIRLYRGGLSIGASKNPDRCTREFTGYRARAHQELHHCYSCRILDDKYLCRRCVRKCHAACNTHRVSGETTGSCCCTHRRVYRPSSGWGARGFNDSSSLETGDACRTQ